MARRDQGLDLLREVVNSTIVQPDIEGYLLVPAALIDRAKAFLRGSTDGELQMCSVDGRAITAGFPRGRTVDQIIQVVDLVLSRLGEQEVPARVKVPPKLTGNGHPFFILSTDVEYVGRVEDAVNQALVEVYESTT